MKQILLPPQPWLGWLSTYVEFALAMKTWERVCIAIIDANASFDPGDQP